jgi:hypothetical protein
MNQHRLTAMQHALTEGPFRRNVRRDLAAPASVTASAPSDWQSPPPGGAAAGTASSA